MADTTKTTATGTPVDHSEAYDFSMRITPANYEALVKERDELAKRQLEAPNEFMHQHYSRMLRSLNQSMDKAVGVKEALDRKTQKAKAKEHQAELKATRANYQMQQIQRRIEAQKAKLAGK